MKKDNWKKISKRSDWDEDMPKKEVFKNRAKKKRAPKKKFSRSQEDYE